MNILRWIVAGLAAFLLGSLPWGLWIGRMVRGLDVRNYGSGNLGATNVYRVLGPRWGIAVLLLDAAKGVGAVFLARAIVLAASGGAASQAGIAPLFGAAQAWAGMAPIASQAGPAFSAIRAWAGLLGLTAAVLGHSFSPFAGFRGGKGVAAAAGGWGALAPLPFAAAMGVWIIVFAATRIVSAGSIAAAIALPIAVALLSPHGGAGTRTVLGFAVLTMVVLVLRHRPNLARLARGEERPLDLRGRGAAGGQGTPPPRHDGDPSGVSSGRDMGRRREAPGRRSGTRPT